MQQPSLDVIGRKYGTGKTVHDYLPHFDELLQPWRDETFDMLEIGVHEGASIRMWHEYFPAARIVGVDIKGVTIEDSLPRYTFVPGSQANLKLLHTLAQDYKFRLIVDDGSHRWGHQIFTFQTLFPWLETGGIYICEDIQTSFGSLAERYHGGAPESAAAYFFRIAQAFVAGDAQKFQQTEDPLLYYIVNAIRSIVFIEHAVILRT